MIDAYNQSTTASAIEDLKAEPEVTETKAKPKTSKKAAVVKNTQTKEDGGMDTDTKDFDVIAKLRGSITNKTMGNTDQNGCRKNVSDVQIFGEDLFKLLSKASSEKEGWMKSTKAMDTGSGCVIQVTTQQRNPDGSYSVAEAVTYVPGVKIREEYAGGVGGTATARRLVARH